MEVLKYKLEFEIEVFNTELESNEDVLKWYLKNQMESGPVKLAVTKFDIICTI